MQRKILHSLFQLLNIALATYLAGVIEAGAVPIDRYFTVNPIRVCDNAGASCTIVNTFAAQTQKIYAQADVLPVFLPTTQINNTASLSVPSVTNVAVAGNGQSSNAGTINMWFVQSMPNASGTLFGEAFVSGNGVAINSTAVNSFNSGVGRMDTVAQELGHNFGLGHSNFGAGGSQNLLTAGSSRSIPGGIGDIAPDGANLDQLTASQISQIRSSPLVKQIPKLVVDTTGSTPFDTNNFFRVSFQSGSSSAYLHRLTLDLTPVHAFFDPTNSPPGFAGSPFATGNLNGLTAGDIAVSGNTDGSRLLTLTFADNAFMVSDSFQFGIDVDLDSCVDCFGATPSELKGSLFTFYFDDGFGSMAALGSDIADVADSSQPSAQIVGFQAIAGGPPIPRGTLDPQDPVAAGTVPEPTSLLLLSVGLIALVVARRLYAAKVG